MATFDIARVKLAPGDKAMGKIAITNPCISIKLGFRIFGFIPNEFLFFYSDLEKSFPLKSTVASPELVDIVYDIGILLLENLFKEITSFKQAIIRVMCIDGLSHSMLNKSVGLKL